LGVETGGLGLGVDVANVVGERLLLLFESLDAFDKGFEVILGNAGGGHQLLLGSGGRAPVGERRFSGPAALASSRVRIHPQAVSACAPCRTPRAARGPPRAGALPSIRHTACRRRS